MDKKLCLNHDMCNLDPSLIRELHGTSCLFSAWSHDGDKNVQWIQRKFLPPFKPNVMFVFVYLQFYSIYIQLLPGVVKKVSTTETLWLKMFSLLPSGNNFLLLLTRINILFLS